MSKPKEEIIHNNPLTLALSFVREFHRTFGQPVGNSARRLSPDRACSRAAWMEEEIREFLEAVNLTDQADAMIDLIYFSLGTLVEMGVDPGPLFEIVQHANMKKLWADGLPRIREDGKIMKPEGWTDPIADVRAQLVRSHTKYELVVAEPFMCVPACLEMIIRAAGYNNVTQNNLAEHFPMSMEISENTVVKCDPSCYGIVLDSGSVNSSLRECGIPLIEDYLPISNIAEESFVDVLRDSIQRYVGVAVGLDASILYTGIPNYGHVCVVAEVDERDFVLLVDPGPKTAGLWDFPAYDLYRAIRRKGDGIWRFQQMTP